MKLTNAELKVMRILWEKKDMTASNLNKILKENIGWNRNTSYTIIKRCIEKGFIERIDPNFVCKAILTQDQAQSESVTELISNFFTNSKCEFFRAFLKEENLSQDEIADLKNIINKLK